MHVLLYVILSAALFTCPHCCEEDEADNDIFQPISPDPTEFREATPPRYLLYDVNPGEGFNLRRDVYMRMATLVQNLNKDAPWILVLPPWGQLYHWKSHVFQERIPWSHFFDLDSLRRLIPIMEFKDFLKIQPDGVIEQVYYLQHYQEGWDTWEEKMDLRDCIKNPYHKDQKTGQWQGRFWGYENEVKAADVKCISVMGHASFLKPFLIKNATASSIVLDRAETILHDRFGDKTYWEVRRSMVFSKTLRTVGDMFRRNFLDSTDEDDKTVLDEDWRKNEKKHGTAKGGPYLAAHLRRQDFAQVRAKDVPNLQNAAKQLTQIMTKYEVKKLFVATDAPQKEFSKLKDLLTEYKVYRFTPTEEELLEYKDGGVAIIDQWISAHARYFIGTRESTFSFRIQDEREILGFDPDTTFNCLCGDEEGETCEQPSRWKIVF